MEAQNRGQMVAQQAPGSTAEPVPGSSDGIWRKFAEPRSWALKWCGFSLFCGRNGQAGGSPPPTNRAP